MYVGGPLNGRPLMDEIRQHGRQRFVSKGQYSPQEAIGIVIETTDYVLMPLRYPTGQPALMFACPLEGAAEAANGLFEALVQAGMAMASQMEAAPNN
jgi:hypothetical protein